MSNFMFAERELPVSHLCLQSEKFIYGTVAQIKFPPQNVYRVPQTNLNTCPFG